MNLLQRLLEFIKSFKRPLAAPTLNDPPLPVTDALPVETKPSVEAPVSPILVEEVKKPSDVAPKYQLPKKLSFSDNGVDLLKKYEGYSAKAFWDYKQWSIGYGSKAKDRNEVIDRKEAFDRLKSEADRFEVSIKKYVTVPLTQNMYDALVSFTYNTGAGWMMKSDKGTYSSVYSALQAKNYKLAAKNLKKYVMAGGKVNKGLVNRREEEYQHFLKDA